MLKKSRISGANGKKKRGRPPVPLEIRGEIIGRYVAGEQVGRLAAEYKLGDRTVSRILADAGVRAEHRITPAPGGQSSRQGAQNGSGVGSGTPRPELREQFAALGDPPADPVMAGEWLHANLMLAARQVATDPELDRHPAERNKALVQIARAAAGVLPAATLARTVRLIQKDAEERDGAGAGADEEDLPAESESNGAHRAAPRRGGPAVG